MRTTAGVNIIGATAAAAIAGLLIATGGGAAADPGAARQVVRPAADLNTRPAAPAEATTPVGRSLIRALAEQRFSAARALLAPDIEFKAITPSAGYIDLRGRAAVMKLMREWYATAEKAERISTGRVIDRRWVDYRIRWDAGADGTMVFAQHAFYDLDRSGRISRMSLVCSGDRAVD